jgi:hypothetical protein
LRDSAESADSLEMTIDLAVALAHPAGEQSEIEEWSAIADTFGGRVHVEWDAAEPVTPLGQLPFFVEYLKQGGLFDGWVADCPLSFTSPNAPRKRDVLGTLLLSVLAGHQRYAHITALRCDPVNPPLLGMRKVVSEDAVRRGLAKIDATAGMDWLQTHLDYCVSPLLRGDSHWGNEPVMARAERQGMSYLFRLRATRNVNRALQKAMLERDWTDAGQGWQGKETSLRLMGWSRQRRVILLRRKLDRPLAVVDRTHPALPQLSFAEVAGKREVWEYAALVTSLHSEILTLGQLYRDRADCENGFDELKNQWGWGGFTTQDLKRCRLLARSVALIYNWWSLFVRLADPVHRREAITSRPLLLQAIAQQTRHAGQVTLTISSAHGEQHKARRAYVRVAGFFARLRQTAEQMDPVQRWYRILSEALRRFLHGRQLIPPARLEPA